MASEHPSKKTNEIIVIAIALASLIVTVLAWQHPNVPKSETPNTPLQQVPTPSPIPTIVSAPIELPSSNSPLSSSSANQMAGKESTPKPKRKRNYPRRNPIEQTCVDDATGKEIDCAELDNE